MAKPRYIDANKIDFKMPCEYEHEEIFVSMDDVRKAIAQTPKEDVKPVVRGRWKICCDGWYPYCSNCHNEPKNGVMSNFCPQCGADMRGEKK